MSPSARSAFSLLFVTLAACVADAPGSSTGGRERDGGDDGEQCVGRSCRDTVEGDDTAESDASSVDGGDDDTADPDATTNDTGETDTAVGTDTDPVDAVDPPDIPIDDRTDTDGDGIIDSLEGDTDFDGDGQANMNDLDSDDDGILDAEEYGRPPGSGQRPVDSDSDGYGNYIDVDSDGDSLADADETGCPGSTNRIDRDSDADGYIDMLEIAFGSDPCDASSDISALVDFYFELPFEAPAQTAELPIDTALESGDVLFSMDITGSMSSAITGLRNSLRTSIIPELAARISDVGIGVSSFADFPCGDFGSTGDVPFILEQRITTDEADAQAATRRLSAAGGGDGPESSIESLYQIATGAGRSEPSCGGTNIPAFNPATDRVAGVADGTVGGAGFRDSQVRVVVQITDIDTHARGEAGYPYGASRAEAYAALNAIDAKVIGLALGTTFITFSSPATADLTEAAEETGAVVEPCAWGPVGTRPSGCGINQCCTGVNGAGVRATGGQCPLVFSVEAPLFGTLRIDTSVVSGIEALLGGTEFEITAVVRRDETEFTESGVDTSCFINGVTPISATTAGCADEPTPADTDGNGSLDGFTGVSPGSSVTFEIEAQNNCVEQTSVPQVFLVYIDLITSEGDSLGTRLVTILVPPRPPKV